MTTPTTDPSIEDMRERLQQLKRVERTKYQCPDYIGDSYRVFENAERLEYILNSREQTLRKLFNWVDKFRLDPPRYITDEGGQRYKLDIDEAVVSITAFIFDRYLSAFVGEGGVPPFRLDLIGDASLFIAVKSQMSFEETFCIERIMGRYSRRVYAMGIDLKILKELNWDVVYPSPIAIIRDLLSLLHCPSGSQQFEGSLEIHKTDVLKEAAYMTKLATIAYGFTTNFSPSTIALATLSVVFEKNRCLSKSIALCCNLIDPVFHMANLFKTYGMDLSFDNDDVKECDEKMLQRPAKWIGSHWQIVSLFVSRSCPYKKRN